MEETPAERIDRQLRFVLELDAAKHVLRRNPLRDGTRRENDAEHMWHLAVMAIVLAEHGGPGLDIGRVIRMVLLHDVVEIDAGDAFVYDEAAQVGKDEREQAAAQRIYGLLPDDQRDELRSLWEEFEAKETPEARFAAALDRLEPLLLNHATRGGAWAEYGILAPQVRARNAPIADASPALWDAARSLIEDAVANGWLRED